MSDPETIFKAFGDATRLRILALLQDHELCVCEIEAALSLSQPNASRSLTILKNAGIIQSRKQAQWTYYKISDDFSAVYPDLSRALENICAGLPSTNADKDALKKCRQTRSCEKCD
ncbi:MAG: metalloregulator ArsR/SmtB family transcription factor [Methanocorpusculum sp.]|uniref:ArsR/SmtB family transcription factor n=1 Tax=Methanocorpusculum sp. TaxID=2058474 RepID=UPI0027232A1E|nr:metalloregulator ArsR/SmtB family transcription factor [Methanocorpusculum sp.]MDO9522447.1 metalloregulator ArsR/SmtB family transcription factor [Methanocorpusculum sp.]